METNAPIRAAVVGAGTITRLAHVPYAQRLPGVEVVAICDVNRARAQAVADEFQVPYAFDDYYEMLARFGSELDAVTISTPNVFHAPMTIAALEAGLHVLCEKPMATTAADAVAMAEAARRANRLLTIGTHYRYRGPVQTLKQLVDAGMLGDIYRARVTMTRRAGIPGYGSWFTRRELAGAGVLFDMGVHALDLGLWLMGFPRVQVVQGVTADVMGRRRRGLGTWGADIHTEAGYFDVDDLASIMVRLANNATLLVEVAWAGYDLPSDTLTLLGTEAGARVVYGSTRQESEFRLFVDLPSGPAEIRPDFPWPESSYSILIANFFEAIRSGGPSPIPLEQSVEVTKILEATLRSAETGHEVSFE